jgi:hypothetical protein
MHTCGTAAPKDTRRINAEKQPVLPLRLPARFCSTSVLKFNVCSTKVLEDYITANWRRSVAPGGGVGATHGREVVTTCSMHMSEYVRIRQQMSGYVSIRPRTRHHLLHEICNRLDAALVAELCLQPALSAYVSIRQHIREDT